MKLHVDIETRSTVDLRKAGQYVYAEHPLTQIIVVCFAIDGQPVQTWLPLASPAPDALLAALADPACTLCAHNASFERVLLTGPAGQRIGIPAALLAPLRRWNCTAARAAAMGLPRTLNGAAAALGLDAQKDRDGAALMLRMCKPKPGSPSDAPVWFEDADRIARLGAYCAQDVTVERMIDDAIPDLSEIERLTWALTERMNDEGVQVDAALLLKTAFLVDEAERDINRRLGMATDGAVKRVSDHGALTRWLAAQGIDDAEDTGVGKAALEALMARDDLPDLVREVVTMRREGGKSSASKYRALLNRMGADHRVRGALVYCGAASSGRWSSRGAQLQNLPRANILRKASTVAALTRDILGDAPFGVLADLYGPPLVLASELLRPVFVAADGHWLARGDYSQIEARVNPWFAGDRRKLDAFRAYDNGTGPDLYKVAAGGIYGVAPEEIDSDDPRRQIGKVSELALGFQGGARALQAMARGYGVKIPHWERPANQPFDQREPAPGGTDEWIKEKWRDDNPLTVQFWRDLNDAAVTCLSSAPGGMHRVREGLWFRRTRAALAMRLPSGRSLVYWTPRLRDLRTPWGGTRPAVMFRAEDAQTVQWGEHVGYGGLWCENAVQATARDLMADALLRLHAAGLRPRLTVHDEGICEPPRSRFPVAAEAAAAIETIMRQTPAWAIGLPVAADASAGPRYLKG